VLAEGRSSSPRRWQHSASTGSVFSMTRVPILWKILLGLIFASLLACVVAWFVLLSTICSNPRAADTATHHTVPYNCHGMTVFITPLERDLLHWLVPVGFVLIVLLHAVVFSILIRMHKTTSIAD